MAGAATVRLALLGLCGLALGCPQAPPPAGEGSGSGAAVVSEGRPDAGRELPDLGLTVSEGAGSSATFSRVPGTISGFYEAPRDSDRVRLRAADLAAVAPAQIEVSGVAGVRPRLTIFGDGGVELASVQADRPGEGAGIPNLGVPTGVSELSVEVTALDGSNPEVPWTLSVHRPERPPGDALEAEPNDRPEQAMPLAPNRTMAGFLHRAEDVDHFAVALSTAASLTLLLAPDPATDAFLEWVPASGAALQIDLAGPGEPEVLCAVGVPAGTHGVAVTRTHAGPILPRYGLTVRLEVEPVEREPNDLTQNEQLQELVDGLRGYIGTAGDVDVFRLRLFGVVDGSAEQVIRVEPSPGVDVAVEVTDSEGASVTPLADAGGPGAREEVRVPLATGLHVIVREGRRGGHGCEVPYVVRLP